MRKLARLFLFDCFLYANFYGLFCMRDMLAYRTHLVVTVLFVLSLLFLPIHGQSASPNATTASQNSTGPANAQDDDLLGCETPLAGDLYGLGVRLGIYFSWFTAWVANNFVEDEISGALDQNAIFLFALAVAVVHCTQMGTLKQIDAIVLLELCAGTVLGPMSVWGYRTSWYRKEGPSGIRHFGGFGTHLRLLLGAGVALYAVWFWWNGIEGGVPKNPKPYPKCQNINILTLPATGAVRYIALVVSFLGTVFSAVMVLVSPLAAYARLMKMFVLARQRKWATSTRLRYATGLNRDELRILSRFLSTFNILWMCLAVTVIELTLNQNSIRGVVGDDGKLSTPAQLMPMLIGAFSFIRILFIWFELWRSPSGDIVPSLGRQASGKTLVPQRDSLSASSIFRLFSPALAEDTAYNPGREIEEQQDHRDEYSRYCSLWQRLLITWLPWLSLLESWPLAPQYRGLPLGDKETASMSERSSLPLRETPRVRVEDWNEEGDVEENHSEDEMYNERNEER